MNSNISAIAADFITTLSQALLIASSFYTGRNYRAPDRRSNSPKVTWLGGGRKKCEPRWPGSKPVL